MNTLKAEKRTMDTKGLQSNMQFQGLKLVHFIKQDSFLSVTVGINRKDCASMPGNQ